MAKPRSEKRGIYAAYSNIQATSLRYTTGRTSPSLTIKIVPLLTHMLLVKVLQPKSLAKIF